MNSKVYPCDLCDKTFSRNGDLTRHKAIHSGEKNHECNVCGMRFAQHSGLKTHQNTHTGAKPHQCLFCDRAFGDPSSRARHEKEKHFPNPFTCPKCFAQIIRRSSFAGHLREKHPEILVTKEYLDRLEGPHLSKPKNRRGRSRPSATVYESRALAKTRTSHYSRSRAMTLNDEIRLPKLMEIGRTENPNQNSAMDKRVEYSCTRRNSDALSLPFNIPDYGASFAGAMSMSQQSVPRFSQSPASYQQISQQEHHPMFEPPNFECGFSMYGAGGGIFETRSVSSSPGPNTPLDIKPPLAYVEPFKINPTDYSTMFSQVGMEHHVPHDSPLMYSYVEQPGLLYQPGM